MIAWPADLPLPFAGGFAPFARSLSGGQALDGTEQVQPQLHDRWQAGFSFHINTVPRLLAMRGLLFGLRGRANTVALSAVEMSQGVSFTNVTGATVAANAALNATVLDVQVGAGVPKVGNLFSTPAAKLYGIQAVTALGGGVYRCTTWPWLRAALTSATALEFANPVCEMRLASDAEGAAALEAVTLGKFGDITLRFDEAP
jgi:hypothetical protein